MNEQEDKDYKDYLKTLSKDQLIDEALDIREALRALPNGSSSIEYQKLNMKTFALANEVYWGHKYDTECQQYDVLMALKYGRGEEYLKVIQEHHEARDRFS